MGLSHQERGAIARRDAARANLHVVQHLIDQSVRNAYVFGCCPISAAAGDEQIKRQMWLSAVSEEADRRTISLDVVNAKQELLDAETAAAAGVDIQIAAYTILAATGQLTAKLNLGVTIYDPAEYFGEIGPTRQQTGRLWSCAKGDWGTIGSNTIGLLIDSRLNSFEEQVIST